MKLILKIVIGAAVATLTALALLLYFASDGVPFVEGDRITTQGEAEGFRIGMTKAEAFDALKEHYRDRDATIRHVWERGSPHAGELARFEAEESRRQTADPYGEYEEAIDSLTTMPRPLAIGDRWDVQLPASWVHSVYVTFEDDRIVEIRHSRWLFERF